METPVTKEEFKRYENVRLSGAINMLDIKGVQRLSNLSNSKIIYIIKNYMELLITFKLSEEIRNDKE